MSNKIFLKIASSGRVGDTISSILQQLHLSCSLAAFTCYVHTVLSFSGCAEHCGSIRQVKKLCEHPAQEVKQMTSHLQAGQSTSITYSLAWRPWHKTSHFNFHHQILSSCTNSSTRSITLQCCGIQRLSEYCVIVVNLVTILNITIEKEGCIVVSRSSQADHAENIIFKAQLQKYIFTWLLESFVQNEVTEQVRET